jgi:spore coat protein U domain-containing protein, fimbrial subunit CupE1/2/3/6
MTTITRRRIARAMGKGLLALACVVVFPAAGHAACTISATGVNFGNYDVYTTSPDDSTATITYRCGNSDNHITVTLSRGSSGTFSPRRMTKAGGEQLAYNVYTDATRTTIWGDGTGGTSIYSLNNPPNGLDVVLTVYGQIPASQDVSVGSYTDTLVATINF